MIKMMPDKVDPVPDGLFSRLGLGFKATVRGIRTRFPGIFTLGAGWWNP